MIVQIDSNTFINTDHIVYFSVYEQTDNNFRLHIRMLNDNSFTITQSESEIEEKIKELTI